MATQQPSAAAFETAITTCVVSLSLLSKCLYYLRVGTYPEIEELAQMSRDWFRLDAAIDGLVPCGWTCQSLDARAQAAVNSLVTGAIVGGAPLKKLLAAETPLPTRRRKPGRQS